MSGITMFESTEEMIEAIRRSTEAADADVVPWQKELKPGDKFFRIVEDVAIYGEILDPMASVEDEEEKEYLQELYSEEHMANYRFAKCYSVVCPQGEMGDVHVSTVYMVLTDTIFEQFRRMEWPCDVDAIREILRAN